MNLLLLVQVVTASNSSIVFLTLNNPLYKRVTRVQAFCPDICQETGWEEVLLLLLLLAPTSPNQVLEGRKNIEGGYTFCCSLQEFRKTVSWLPDISTGSGEQDLLHYIS